MIRPAVILLSVFLAGNTFAAECVVLLHGLARTSMSLNPMQEALQDAGFQTANIDYPSREYDIAELAAIAVTE